MLIQLVFQISLLVCFLSHFLFYFFYGGGYRAIVKVRGKFSITVQSGVDVLMLLPSLALFCFVGLNETRILITKVPNQQVVETQS